VGVIELLSHLNNGICISKFGCVLMNCGLQCEQPVVWETKRKWLE